MMYIIYLYTILKVSQILVQSSLWSSQFINDNFDYDEHSALKLLASFGLEEYLFQVAKVRIFYILSPVEGELFL